MRELPGLYWDEVRQRYFPEASRPKSAPTRTSRTSAQQPTVKFHPVQQKVQTKLNSFSALKKTQRTHSNSLRDRERHSLLTCQIASTSSSTSVRVPIVYSAAITSLKVSNSVEEGAPKHIFLGDRQGWCYAGDSVDNIVAEVCLRSEISSIQQSPGTTVYTSFGPDPQLLVRNSTTFESFLLRPPQLRDVRTSRLNGRSLTLGMCKKALYFPNLENARTTQVLQTESDVFALYCDIHDVWAGTRNGTVRVFDLRSNQSQDALGARFYRRHVSVTNLQRLREYQLLVAAIDGSLEIFDIRFSRGDASAVPLLTLTGHLNTFTHNLGLTVDPSEDFLFAAGQDQRIRGWSLRTGAALETLPISPDVHNPFSKTFAQPVYALQATSDGPAGTLWAASGLELERFDLGKHRTRLTP